MNILITFFLNWIILFIIHFKIILDTYEFRIVIDYKFKLNNYIYIYTNYYQMFIIKYTYIINYY